MNKAFWMLSFIILTGCESTPIQVENAQSPTQLKSFDIQDIALAADDVERLDPYYALDGSLLRRKVVTGPIWRRGFIGSDPAISFNVTSAELRLTSLPNGFAVLLTYTAEGVLTINGEQFSIKAVGGKSTGPQIDLVIREAIELAVVDASRQITKIKERIRNKTAQRLEH